MLSRRLSRRIIGARNRRFEGALTLTLTLTSTTTTAALREELKIAGYTGEELLSAGLTAQDLWKAGFFLRELCWAGSSPQEWFNAGFNAQNLTNCLRAGGSPPNTVPENFLRGQNWQQFGDYLEPLHCCLSVADQSGLQHLRRARPELH